MKLNPVKISFYAIVILFCVCGLSCASIDFAGTKIASVPDDFFGVAPDRSPLTKNDFALLDDLSIEWFRTTIYWDRVEPEKGKWNFNYYDNYVAKAEEAGKKVIFVLAYDNGWLYENNKARRIITEKELPFYLDYLEQVVRRYKTRIVYEIWNEPNFVFWKGTYKQYIPFYIAAAEKIRELEPEAEIIGGSTFRVSNSLNRKLFNSGAMKYVDGYSVHPYGVTPAATVRLYNKLAKNLDKYEFNKPIWITEVGFWTGPRPLFNLKRYPEYITKILSCYAARAGEVRNVIWYELLDNYMDNKKNERNPLNHMGLIYQDSTLKHGAKAFMLTAGHLAGSEYNPQLPLRDKVSKNITSLYFKREDGTNILIIWKNGGGKRKLALSVPSAENISLHNYNMEITPIIQDAVLEAGRDPLFITWKNGESPRIYKK